MADVRLSSNGRARRHIPNAVGLCGATTVGYMANVSELSNRTATTAPPGLAIVAIILWCVLSGFCCVIALVLLSSIGFTRPLPAVFALAGIGLFAVEARWVWTGRRRDVLWSGIGSLGLAAAWWLVGSGESRGFAYVPPAVMVAAGLAVLASRSAYLSWSQSLPTRREAPPE